MSRFQIYIWSYINIPLMFFFGIFGPMFNHVFFANDTPRNADTIFYMKAQFTSLITPLSLTRKSLQWKPPLILQLSFPVNIMTLSISFSLLLLPYPSLSSPQLHHSFHDDFIFILAYYKVKQIK